jgi:nitrate/nitrite transport system substrate-binding protein
MTMKTNRRTFLRVSGAALGGLMAGLPGAGPAAPTRTTHPKPRRCASASSRSPTACADRHGARARLLQAVRDPFDISKEASWAVIRDKLSMGENQAMLIGMPIASTLGLAGSPVKPMIVPWLLNRNGQAITFSNKLKEAGIREAKPLKALADKARAAGAPMAFAMTFPAGTHAV